MNANAWGAFFTGLGVIVAALALFLGVPQWRMGRRQLRQQEIVESIRLALTGDKPLIKPSPDNPAALDQLRDIHGLLREQFEISAIVLHHISDGHGGEQPPWLMHNERR